MMMSTFLDLGLASAPTVLSGAPTVAAAGAAAPDFAAAMAGLLTGTAPDALATGVAGNRQDFAADGKIMPRGDMPKRLKLGDFAGIAVALPALVPDPTITSASAVPTGKDDPTVPLNATETADLGDPQQEPALAWLMPPVPVVTAVPTLAAAPAPVTKAAVAVPPNGTVSPRDAGAGVETPGKPFESSEAPPMETTPASAAAPAPSVRQLATALPDSLVAPTVAADRPTPLPLLATDKSAMVLDPALEGKPGPLPEAPLAPASPVARAAAPVFAELPARVGAAVTLPPQLSAATAVPLPAPVAADLAWAMAAPVETLAARGEQVAVPIEHSEQAAPAAVPIPASITTKVAATPWLKPRTGSPETVPTRPARAGPREALAAIPEAQLRAAATQRIEIQPVPMPGRDNGAMLAAAAAIRAAPTVMGNLAEAWNGLGPAGPILDAGVLAPIAAGASAAPPVGAAQQPGIDLTRDPGMHHMIDRIEQLRDAFDARDTRIRLIPDALGPVDISVRREADGDSVRVHFTAAEAGTRQLIAEAQHRLVELADSRGVRIERATVDSGPGNSASNGIAQQSSAGDDQQRQHQQHAQTNQPSRAPARAARDDEPDSTDKRIA